jgi:glycosyltransferase involved in cell wall biosynthesis
VRILHVIPGLTQERGGPSTCVAAVTRHQSAAGHAVTVLTTDQGLRHGERETTLSPTVRLERCRVVGPDRVAYAPRFAGLVRSLIRETDVVHAHSIFTHPMHATFRAARASGVPLVLRPCGLLHGYSLRRSAGVKSAYLTLWGSLAKQACSAWHYTSRGEAADSWPRDGSRGFVVPNGIEPEEFSLDRGEARRLVARVWPDVGAAPFVLFLGRLHPKKRLDLLLEAFLDDAPAGCKLMVVGPDEQDLWPELQRRYLRGRNAERVVRAGLVAGEQKAALLAAADLFALPSEHENFGIAALEALAAGTPVLLSPHVDLAGDETPASGLYRAPLVQPDWGRRLAELLTDRAALVEGGTCGRAWAHERFAWSRIAADLVDRYQWVLSGCPGDSTPAEVRP